MFLDKEALIYVIAVSLQVAGALLLLCYNVSAKRKNIIKSFASTKGCIQVQGTKIEYDKHRLKEIFKLAYINKMSFLYIVVGYIAGVFGKIGDNTYILSIILGMVAFISLFICIGISIPKCILLLKEKRNGNFFDITNEDIKELGIKDITNVATDEEVNNAINKTFGIDMNEIEKGKEKEHK